MALGTHQGPSVRYIRLVQDPGCIALRHYTGMRCNAHSIGKLSRLWIFDAETRVFGRNLLAFRFRRNLGRPLDHGERTSCRSQAGIYGVSGPTLEGTRLGE
jgi:hypothetical protein